MSGAETTCTATFGARIIVMADHGMSSLEGVIVDGLRDEDGLWDLDGQFQLVDDDGGRFWVNGWCCLIELDEGEETKSKAVKE